MLLVITFRPEFQPPWGGRAHVTSLALNRLGEREGEALVQKLAGNSPLTPEIVADIVERTDGVPLFIEELTKAVLESAAQGDQVGRGAGDDIADRAAAVPATLHASLTARLDRLGPAAKEIAQIGAVLGRDFAYELIQPVAKRFPKWNCRPLVSASSMRGCYSAAAPRRTPLISSSMRWCRTLPTHLVARAAPGIARSRRGGAGRGFPRCRRAPAGAACPSFDCCRQCRTAQSVNG